jgi:hypothetical protein
MALPVTSGTAAFLVSRDDVIDAALRSLRVISVGQTPLSVDYTNCAFALNTLLKELNVSGKMAWVYQTISTPFVASQAVYTIAESGSPSLTNARPVDIVHAWRRDGSTPPIDTPMTRLTRQEYDQLTPKGITGVPTNWYYDPQIGLSSVTVWPTPLDATNTLYMCIQRPIQDITSSTQNFDIPQEGFSALRWILADEVSSEYRVDMETLAYVRAKAKEKREQLVNFAQEEGSVYFMPDPQMLGRR